MSPDRMEGTGVESKAPPASGVGKSLVQIQGQGLALEGQPLQLPQQLPIGDLGL